MNTAPRPLLRDFCIIASLGVLCRTGNLIRSNKTFMHALHGCMRGPCIPEACSDWRSWSCMQQQSQYLHQFVLHAALDAIDEAMWTTKEPHLKVGLGWQNACQSHASYIQASSSSAPCHITMSCIGYHHGNITSQEPFESLTILRYYCILARLTFRMLSGCTGHPVTYKQSELHAQ